MRESMNSEREDTMEPRTQTGGGGGGKEPPKFPPTDQMFGPEPGENPNQPRPGESPEEFFNRTGYTPSEPTGQKQGSMHRQEPGSYRSEKHQEEVAQFLQLQDQMIEETRGFATELAVYLKTLLANDIPFQGAFILSREWQQAEITRRAQMDMLERRMEQEG